MQQERTGQEKEKQERTRLEKEKQERKKAEGLPEWARGRPDAVCIMMDPRVQKVLYPDNPPQKRKKARRFL